MVVEKDIVAISIPFSAGVVTAVLVPPGGDVPYTLAAGACLAAAGLLWVFTGRGERFWAALALYFLLGLCCGAGAVALGPSASRDKALATQAADALLRAIDGAGFRHEDTAALLKALLAGHREDLDRATVAAFRAAGASHILALSGLHLGILYGILQLLLAPLGRSRAATALRSGASIAAAAFYLAMTGASPSLVRAFLFILFNELSRLLSGRCRSPVNIYCAALTIQLTASPGVVGSLGFQLSYLAMLGIVLIFPRLEAWYPPSSRWDPLRRLWSAAALTLSCQVFTAPLVWIRFHSFPRHFLLTNLCALPLTEGFIFCALPSLLRACPEGIKNLADFLGQTLLAFLKTVASLT